MGWGEIIAPFRRNRNHMAIKSPFKARASLLDRLVDENPKTSVEGRPLRTLSRKKLRESLAADLSRLFNTRTPVSPKEWDRRELTVIDYGMPDFSAYSPSNPDHHAELARRMKRAIEVFEPRLTKVNVEVDPDMIGEKNLRVYITGIIVVEETRIPVSFKTVLNEASVTTEVNGVK